MENPQLYLQFDKSLYRLETEKVEFVSDIDPDRIISGSSVSSISQSIGLVLSGKTGFSNNETGYILGNDEGTQKFYIGTTSDYFNFNGTNVAISGALSAGSISIGTSPDWFNVDSSGNIWSGNATLAGAKTNTFAVEKEGLLYCKGATIDGTSAIGGRTASTIASAIDASGHFADDAISTASGTILGEFSFSGSGALQIGTYVNGTSGDLKISPTGILGRDKTGTTTFSINGTTGVAVLNGLVVGTNVGLGTAEDSTGVTTIIGDTVTTPFLNAKNIVAGSVAAEDITGTTITGKTIRTDTTGNDRLEIRQTGEGSHPNELVFVNSSNVVIGGMVAALVGSDVATVIDCVDGVQLADATSGRYVFLTGTNFYVDATLLPVGAEDIGKSGTEWNKLWVDEISLNGTSRTTWPTAGVTDHSDLTNVTASQHHTKYTDSDARSAVTGTTLPGNLVLGNHEVNDVSYLKFDSSYGRIYHGATEILDFYSTYLDCNVELKMNDENISGVDNLYVDDIYGNNVTEIDVFESFDMNGHNVNGIDTLSFDANTGNPSSAGQIQYYDYGGVQQFRANVGGWTGRFDLIAT